MPSAFALCWRRVPKVSALVVTGLLTLPSTSTAVDKDKVLFVGGTMKSFAPPPARPLDFRSKIEGRLRLNSSTDFVFDAGVWGALVISLKSVSSIGYGLKPYHRATKALRLRIPWDLTEQFTDNAHNLLTVTYQDQSGVQEEIVIELGKDLVRPTLESLERGTGQPVEFVNVEACMLLKDAEACGFGKPGELRGLKKVFLDNNMSPARREFLRAEIDKANSGLQLLETIEGAEIILKYDGAHSQHPECPCEGGRGEASIRQGERERVVLVFMGRKKGMWGKPPMSEFVRTFLEAVTATHVSGATR